MLMHSTFTFKEFKTLIYFTPKRNTSWCDIFHIWSSCAAINLCVSRERPET